MPPRKNTTKEQHTDTENPKDQNDTPVPYEATGSDVNLLREIDNGSGTGNFRFVSQAEAGHLVRAGLVTVDISKLDDNKNAAASLTPQGKTILENANAAPANAPGTDTAPAAGTPGAAPSPSTVKFHIVKAEPPKPSRPQGATARTPKYPQLDTLEIGYAVFLELEAGKDLKAVTKTIQSNVADRNAANKEKYFTARAIEDGGKAGLGDEFAGKAGTAIYRRPVEERKTRAPRKPKDGAVAAAPATEGVAAPATE
jgi:hypothetical protein